MKTMDIEVVNLRKLKGDGKKRAFADLRINGSLIIKGFSVVDGRTGLFASLPQQAGKDGRWFDILQASEELKRQMLDKVLEAYDRESGETIEE